MNILSITLKNTKKVDFLNRVFKLNYMKKHLETKTRLEIKKLYEETDYTLNDLAELYGVCQRTIFRIVHGELYLKKVNKRFTDEELKQHEKERQKRYREENKEK